MEWKVDPQHTSVEFTARHMMISKVRGPLRVFEGNVTIDEANPELSKLEGTIQVDSFYTAIADRDAHLRSGDLFNVRAVVHGQPLFYFLDPPGSQPPN